MRRVLQEIFRRDAVLAIAGCLQIGVLAVAIAGLLIDDRTVLGISVWAKPAKFAASIAIYAWTLAWLMPYVTGPRWGKMLVRWGTLLAMTVEIACIAGQAARGRRSHFNGSTPLDGAIFSAMGMFIAFSTVLEVVLLAMFFTRHVSLPRAYLWGIRCGLAGAILASITGVMMVKNNAHSVGGRDGGAGLPVVNWSTQYGDLRPAHALALHSLQILPVVGYGLSRLTTRSQQWQVRTLFSVVALYAAITAAITWQAIEGRPLVQSPDTLHAEASL